MIKIIYAILLGVILASFIGLGIEAFYPTEKYPEYPQSLQITSPIKDGIPSENLAEQQKYDQTLKDYNAGNTKHARNVSLIAITGSIILMVLSLTILSRKDVFSDGFLIGSFITLVYGIGRGFESNDNIFRFIIVSIGLAVALILGSFKFLSKNKEMSS